MIKWIYVRAFPADDKKTSGVEVFPNDMLLMTLSEGKKRSFLEGPLAADAICCTAVEGHFYSEPLQMKHFYQKCRKSNKSTRFSFNFLW